MQLNMDRNKVLSIIAAVLLGVLFIYSSLSKLLEISSFSAGLYKSPIIIDALVPFMTIAVPLIEVVAALLLVSRKTRYFGFLVSFFLMCSFTIYLSIITNLFINIPCKCGALFKDMSFSQHIFINIIFIIIAAVGSYSERIEKSPSVQFSPTI